MTDETTDTLRMKAILTVAAALAFAAAPAVAPRFDGYDPSQMPVAFAFPPVQPADYTFAIWGLIFLWLIGHALFGLVSRADDPDWDEVRWPLIGAMVLGAPWLAVAGFSPLWATVMIWAMLLMALWALFDVALDYDRWLLPAPIALFAGWLTAASWVALSTLAAGYGWGDSGFWAWAGLAGALATAVAIQLARPAPLYGVALVWALIGVAVAALAGGREAQAIAALVGAAIMAVLAARAARAARAL